MLSFGLYQTKWAIHTSFVYCRYKSDEKQKGSAAVEHSSIYNFKQPPKLPFIHTKPVVEVADNNTSLNFIYETKQELRPYITTCAHKLRSRKCARKKRLGPDVRPSVCQMPLQRNCRSDVAETRGCVFSSPIADTIWLSNNLAAQRRRGRGDTPRGGKEKKDGCCPQTIIDTRDRHSTRRITMALLQCRVFLHAANFPTPRQFFPCRALENYFASRRIPYITINKPFRDVNGSAIILRE